MQIIAWKCVDTGKIFESEPDYRKHRFEYIKNRRENNHKDRRIKECEAIFSKFRSEASTFSEIENWFRCNSDVISRYITLINNNDIVRSESRIRAKFESLEFKCIWNDKCSNTHSAPLNGGIKNWRGNPEFPTGYPGFRGRIQINLNSDNWFRLYEFFGKFGIFLGSGGGSSYTGKYSYDVILYAADWPGLFYEHESAETMRILKKEF